MAEPMQITLVDEDAIEFVRSKVRSGEYAHRFEVKATRIYARG